MNLLGTAVEQAGCVAVTGAKEKKRDKAFNRNMLELRQYLLSVDNVILREKRLRVGDLVLGSFFHTSTLLF